MRCGKTLVNTLGPVLLVVFFHGFTVENAIARSHANRIVKVRIVADQLFRELDSWELRIQHRLGAVSSFYQRFCGIRFVVERIVAWESRTSAPTLEDLYFDLHKKVDIGDADILLGVSAYKPPVGTKQGWSLQLFRQTVVLDSPGYSELDKIVMIAHELGHLFGAWHIENRNSVMYVGSGILRFDRHSLRLLRLMRHYDFKRGLSGVEQVTASEITAIYQESERAADEINPLSSAHNTLGLLLEMEGKLEDAARKFREAIRIDPTNRTATENLIRVCRAIPSRESCIRGLETK